MVETGRQARQKPEVRAKLVELSKTTPHLRQMSLFGFQAAGDGKNLCRMASEDPSRRLRCRALKAAASVAADEEITQLLDRLSLKEIRRGLRWLHQRGRQEVIDRWVLSQSEAPTEALGYSSPKALEPNLARLLERGSRVVWRCIALRQPEWASSVCLDGDLDSTAVTRVSTVLDTLADRRWSGLWELWRKAVEVGYEAICPRPNSSRLAPWWPPNGPFKSIPRKKPTRSWVPPECRLGPITRLTENTRPSNFSSFTAGVSSRSLIPCGRNVLCPSG